MKKKDKYHVKYVEPYFYIFDDVGKDHFGFFSSLEEAEWRCAWLNAL